MPAFLSKGVRVFLFGKCDKNKVRYLGKKIKNRGMIDKNMQGDTMKNTERIFTKEESECEKNLWLFWQQSYCV